MYLKARKKLLSSILLGATLHISGMQAPENNSISQYTTHPSIHTQPNNQLYLDAYVEDIIETGDMTGTSDNIFANICEPMCTINCGAFCCLMAALGISWGLVCK